MAMNFRPISNLRWALPLFLCVGMCGLGGCSGRYHSQHSSAIDGGHIGKGAVGKGAKKRGGFGPSADFGLASASASPSDSSDPFGGLGETKRSKSGAPKSPSSRSGVPARTTRSNADQNLFDTGPRAPRTRASDPFNDL